MMQIASLISNDDFMSSFNVSIPTNDFVEGLGDFIEFWIYESYNFYPEDINAIWLGKFEVNLTRTLHPKGFCFTFNLPKAADIFNMDL
jgi:hypothetical protein